VMAMSETLYPAPGSHPLADARVKLHIEDGRYFLATTRLRFDLITGEPPPPHAAGAVNLYTREYFRLMHSRLEPGGITTYWLPVRELSVADTKAIVAAFCEAFDDCSLWAGSGYDWMLVGTRQLGSAVSEAEFTRQWQDPTVGAELRALGFEQPEQLGALFMADAPQLRGLSADTLPLSDD